MTRWRWCRSSSGAPDGRGHRRHRVSLGRHTQTRNEDCMSDTNQTRGLQLRSLVTTEQTVEVSLTEVEVTAPGPDEVVVRVEASAINPSDLGGLFAGADLSRAEASGTPERPVITAPLPDGAARAAAGRIGESMPVGNEGAGTVVAAGSSAAAQRLLGKVVAGVGGAMYAQYRCLHASAWIELPEGAEAVSGAASFVNPMTALGHGGDDASRGPHRARPHGGRFEPRSDAQPAVPRGAGAAREHRPVPGAGRAPARGGRDARLRHEFRDVRRRSWGRPARDRCDPRLRRHRRRAARRADPVGDGDGPQRRRGLQPLRIVGRTSRSTSTADSIVARRCSTGATAWRGASEAGSSRPSWPRRDPTRSPRCAAAWRRD